MVKLIPPISELKATISEFSEALKTLEVTKLDERTFSVKNIEKGTEYIVVLEVIPASVAEMPEDVFDAECTCEDFTFRKKRLGKPCKHIYAVLRDFFEGKFSEPIRETKATKSEMAKEVKVEKEVMKPETTLKVLLSADAVIPRELQVQVQEVKEETVKEEEIAKTLDELDEKIMMREWFAGQTPLVYRVMIKDQPRFLLSVRGWVQAALLQKNVVVETIEFFTVKDKLVAIAWAKDVARNVRSFGIAERAPEGEFKLTILASKAMRNALKNVIAPEYERKVIEMAQEMKAIFDLRGF